MAYISEVECHLRLSSLPDTAVVCGIAYYERENKTAFTFLNTPVSDLKKRVESLPYDGLVCKITSIRFF